MTLSNSMYNALSGMSVNSRLTEVTSHNLANALTDGYGRQSVNIGSAVLGGQGVGVAARSVTRATAPQFTDSRRQADGEAAKATIEAEALSTLGFQLGEATSNDGLFRAVETFEATLRQLADTPESQPLQRQAVDAAKDLTAKFNTISDQVQDVRSNADAAIARDVSIVNRNLSAIEDLNAKIKRLTVLDRNVPDLVDQRERLIDEVNAIIPVKTQAQENSVVHLHTNEGVFLLQDRAIPLEYTPTAIVTEPMAYDPAGGGVLSGLTVLGLDIAPGSPTGGAMRLSEGTLAGHFSVRDQISVDYTARIDQFAADVVARFEDPAVDPTLAPGDTGLFTDAGAVLDLTNVEGLAGRISVNTLVDPVQGGDAARMRDGLQSVAPGPVASDTIPRNLLDALTIGRDASTIPGLAGNLGAFGMVAGIVEVTGIARTNSETNAARLSSTRETLADAEADRLGVNQDEELQALIQIEQAFAANVQVIQTASSMLQDILEIR